MTNIEDRLILVDMIDREIGSCSKMETHMKGLLHRAFSVFVFRGNELLIQKRAAGKYHSGGKWANSCCSHPRRGEQLADAVSRRLKEECGINPCTCDDAESKDRIFEAGAFVYRAVFENGLCEYEYDHVFVMEHDGFVRNPEEAEEMKYVSIDWLLEDMIINPDAYAPWFITALPIALDYREKHRQPVK